MKTLRPPLWKTAVSVLTLLVVSFHISAQTININSTFSSDSVIYPFSAGDTIYGLSVSGQATLYSDTSLIRIIVEDALENRFMAFEAYPLIVTDPIVSFVEECDETCYLNGFVATSVEIQIIHAQLELDSLFTSGLMFPDMDSLQLAEKQSKDVSKISLINQNILQRGWNWTAGQCARSEMFYGQKANAFHFDKLNLQGFDYYLNGEFEYISSKEFITDNGSFRTAFDWRDKHNANVENTFYFNSSGHGWLTELRNQGESCGSCWVFGPVACMESVLNLFYNQHLNFDLSEQDVLCCSEGGNCAGGEPDIALIYLADSGTFNEENYPYSATWSEDCCGKDLGNENYLIRSSGSIVVPIGYQSIDTVKKRLLKYGPVSTYINNEDLRMNHVMSLIGFYTDEDNYVQFVFKDSYGSFDTMKLCWDDIQEMRNIKTGFTFEIGEEPYIEPYDNDKDGYWNWGIGPVASELETICGLDPIEDWNDNNNRIGTFDANYNGIQVKPEIKVCCYREMLAKVYVDSNSFFPVYDNDPNAVNGTYTFRIENPGNAQLNLQALTTITNSNETNFTLDVSELDTEICMDGGYTEFSVTFNDQGNPGPLMTVIHINVNQNDHDVAKYFEFAMLHDACQNLGTTNTITSNETWSGFSYSQQNIHLQTGITLTIDGTLGMAEDCRITVDRGAHLKIDGGKVTSLCNKLWEGIDIWGDGSLPQTIISQGTVTARNGAMIEYAERGIETARYDGSFYYQSGGMVYCDGAVFKDNLTGIYFHRYQNQNPSGEPLPNQSRIRNAVFKTTDQLGGLDYTTEPLPEDGIHMTGVDGIVISGSTFGNYSDDPSADRGTGIYSMNGGYYLECKCATTGQNPCTDYLLNTFENLRYGVRAFTDGSQNTITIDSVSFKDNYRGVFMSGLYDARILRSSLDLTDTDDFHPDAGPIAGISLEYCQRYQLEENNFFKNPGIGAQKCAGLQVLNSGPVYNEVYKNSFGFLDAGIIAAGENRDESGLGLCLICNDFTDVISDIYVADQGGSIQSNLGIALWQGEDNGAADGPASNIFSDFQNLHFNIENISTNLFYYVHHTNQPDIKLMPEPVNDEEMVRRRLDDEAEFIEDESCPSNLGVSNIDLQEELFSIGNEMVTILAYKDTLNQVTDGGNTETLVYEVSSSTPYDALIIRQDLIDESPYLSDTVMQSAILKEDVLPNLMLRDILVANPQAAKSPEVMSTLNSKDDTMPQYMIDEIQQGINVIGAKELLEKGLLKHTTKRSASLHQIIRSLRSDTTILSASDTLPMILQSENEMSKHLQAANLYLDRNDTLRARAILDSIPYSFNLSATDQIAYDQSLDLFDLLFEFAGDSCLYIDSTQLLNLYSLASLNSITGIFARNILVSNQTISLTDSIFLPDYLKNTQATFPVKNITTAKSVLSVFPNPANSYFIIQAELIEPNREAFITISDLNGRQLQKIILKNSVEQFLIPVANFSSGVYIIHLYNCGERIESLKISLI